MSNKPSATSQSSAAPKSSAPVKPTVTGMPSRSIPPKGKPVAASIKPTGHAGKPANMKVVQDNAQRTVYEVTKTTKTPPAPAKATPPAPAAPVHNDKGVTELVEERVTKPVYHPAPASEVNLEPKTLDAAKAELLEAHQLLQELTRLCMVQEVICQYQGKPTAEEIWDMTTEVFLEAAYYEYVEGYKSDVVEWKLKAQDAEAQAKVRIKEAAEDVERAAEKAAVKIAKTETKSAKIARADKAIEKAAAKVASKQHESHRPTGVEAHQVGGRAAAASEGRARNGEATMRKESAAQAMTRSAKDKKPLTRTEMKAVAARGAANAQKWMDRSKTVKTNKSASKRK